MKDLEQSRRLLAMAEKDLRALEGMLKDREAFSNEVFGFHAQQAVEKAAKSLLGFVGVAYPKAHDLEELFALAKDAGRSIPGELMDLVDLVDFAVQYRYESFDEDLPIDRPATLRKVTAFIDFVKTAQRPA
jgi:HEPN domain-containing protein